MRIPFLIATLTAAICPCVNAHENVAVTPENAKEAYEAGRFKEAILCYRQLADCANSDLKAEWLCRLALAHYRDQDDVLAFSRYLEALDAVVPEAHASAITADEQEQYAQALRLYLDASFGNPREMSMKLRSLVAPVMEAHPDYHMLNFFIAIIYANLGMFDQFFNQFFQSYEIYPHSYLAQKTRGIVHIKLFERLNDPEAREVQRELALQHFQAAQKLNAGDYGLCKLLICFSSQDNRATAVRQQITHLLQENVMVPRSDIQFYTQEAIRTNEYDLAKQFLDRAKQWYRSSKIVDAAERLLEQKLPTN
jgi:hypothetical protein